MARRGYRYPTLQELALSAEDKRNVKTAAEAPGAGQGIGTGIGTVLGGIAGGIVGAGNPALIATGAGLGSTLGGLAGGAIGGKVAEDAQSAFAKRDAIRQQKLQQMQDYQDAMAAFQAA